jgi:hypothetical protein
MNRASAPEAANATEHTSPIPYPCHSEPGAKPGEEPAVPATALVERTLLSVALDLDFEVERAPSPAAFDVALAGVPHFSRTLREVGFHNSQPHGISIPPKIAPQVQRWKSGASAPRNAHTIRNRASALVDFGCKHFLIARPAGKRKARPGKPPHALAPKAPLTSNACAPCATTKSTSRRSPSSANRSGPQPSSPCRNQKTA